MTARWPVTIRASSKHAGMSDDYALPRGEQTFASLAEWNGAAGLAWRLAILADPAIKGQGQQVRFEIIRGGKTLRFEAL